jgi:hypothetical protein
MLRITGVFFCLAIGSVVTGDRATATTVVDFEELGTTLAPDSAYVGADGAGGYTSQGATFSNNYDPTFGSWIGNAYSRRTSFTSGGFAEFNNNNDTVAAPRAGVGGSATWGIANSFTPNSAVIEAPNGAFFDSLYVTNTATVEHILSNGNLYADPFGGPSGSEPDLFTVRFNDLSPGANGWVEFVLADFRFSDPQQDYIVTDWNRVDLSPLNRATRIGVEFTSTDMGPFGINTPTYVAIDNIAFASPSAVPEPGPMATVTVLGCIYAWRRRRRTHAGRDRPTQVG